MIEWIFLFSVAFLWGMAVLEVALWGINKEWTWTYSILKRLRAFLKSNGVTTST